MGRCEVDARLHELASRAKSASGRLDEEQTELRDFVGFANQEYAADSLAIAFSDPAVFARRIEVPNEVRRDLRNEVTKSEVPPVFGGVNLAMPPHYPLDVV